MLTGERVDIPVPPSTLNHTASMTAELRAFVAKSH
jgi:hypothetical protein